MSKKPVTTRTEEKAKEALQYVIPIGVVTPQAVADAIQNWVDDKVQHAGPTWRDPELTIGDDYWDRELMLKLTMTRDLTEKELAKKERDRERRQARKKVEAAKKHAAERKTYERLRAKFEQETDDESS